MRFGNSHLIVFEGLDATGKTTHADMFNGADNLLVQHQPSDATGIGHEIYALTEAASAGARNAGELLSPVAQQFLHLAAHAEHYDKQLIPALGKGSSVILDRCWWSTVAYGYFGAGLEDQVELSTFLTMAQLPTQRRMPDLVFLFNAPYKDDSHNTEGVQKGYSWLARQHYSDVVTVPVGTKEEVHNFIHGELYGRFMLDTEPKS